MTNIADILTCYRSGQISEAEMVEICREWPEVEAALRDDTPCTDCDNTGWAFQTERRCTCGAEPTGAYDG